MRLVFRKTLIPALMICALGFLGKCALFGERPADARAGAAGRSKGAARVFDQKAERLSCRRLKNDAAQYVLISFDGTPNKFLLDFAGAHPRVKFTFFVSAVLFVTDDYGRRNYRQPRGRSGASRLGFGGAPSEARANRERTLRALGEGHEIACHFNGHFSGTFRYRESEWREELRWFESHTLPWIRGKYPLFRFYGVRAPYLETSGSLRRLLKKSGYLYDASLFSHRAVWPRKTREGVYGMPIDVLYLGRIRRYSLAMDYNVRRFQVKYGLVNRSLRLAEYSRALNRLFRDRYYGRREPLHLANHVHTAENGAYNRSLTRFAAEACALPEVKCVTYRRLSEILRAKEHCAMKSAVKRAMKRERYAKKR